MRRNGTFTPTAFRIPYLFHYHLDIIQPNMRDEGANIWHYNWHTAEFNVQMGLNQHTAYMPCNQGSYNLSTHVIAFNPQSIRVDI